MLVNYVPLISVISAERKVWKNHPDARTFFFPQGKTLRKSALSAGGFPQYLREPSTPLLGINMLKNYVPLISVISAERKVWKNHPDARTFFFPQGKTLRESATSAGDFLLNYLWEPFSR